jgi:uncharacterized glyoxalase superfamily protein PhnB
VFRNPRLTDNAEILNKEAELRARRRKTPAAESARKLVHFIDKELTCICPIYFRWPLRRSDRFYKQAIGAKVEMLMHLKESQGAQTRLHGTGLGKQVMHACMQAQRHRGDGVRRRRASRIFRASRSLTVNRPKPTVISRTQAGGRCKCRWKNLLFTALRHGD